VLADSKRPRGVTATGPASATSPRSPTSRDAVQELAPSKAVPGSMQRPPGQIQPLSRGMPAAVLKSYQAFAGQLPRNEARQRWEKGERPHCQQIKKCKFVAVQYMHEAPPICESTDHS
jgi:hypothetical protein